MSSNWNNCLRLSICFSKITAFLTDLLIRNGNKIMWGLLLVHQNPKVLIVCASQYSVTKSVKINCFG